MQPEKLISLTPSSAGILGLDGDGVTLWLLKLDTATNEYTWLKLSAKK